MDRVVGIETEYGCLLRKEESHLNSDVWPTKVKNYLFRKANAGTIDLHYRDYEEPPGNGGFLLYSRGGGHIVRRHNCLRPVGLPLPQHRDLRTALVGSFFYRPRSLAVGCG